MDLEPYFGGAYQEHGYFGHYLFVKKINESDSEYFFVRPITFD